MMRQRIKGLIKWGLLLLGAGTLYAVFCTAAGWAVPCLFNEITGLYCPGCGVTRMALSLLRLDFPGAFRANMLLFVLLPFWAAWCIVKLVKYIRTGSFATEGRKDKIFITVTLVLLIIFGAARNIPALSWLAPQ